MECTLIDLCEDENTKLYTSSFYPGHEIYITKVNPKTFKCHIFKIEHGETGFNTCNELKAALTKFMQMCEMDLILIQECEIQNMQLYKAEDCPDYNFIVTHTGTKLNYRILKLVRAKKDLKTLKEVEDYIKKYA